MKKVSQTFILTCHMVIVSCSDRSKNAANSVGDTGADMPASLISKLDRIVIPKVHIDGSTIEEAVDFARICSIEYDPERDTKFRGVSIIERRSRAAQDGVSDGYRGIGIDDSAQKKTMTYAAENVRLLDFVREIARQAALDAYFTSAGIVFVPEGSAPFPNAKAEKGDVWKILRQSENKKGEVVAPNGP